MRLISIKTKKEGKNLMENFRIWQKKAEKKDLLTLISLALRCNGNALQKFVYMMERKYDMLILDTQNPVKTTDDIIILCQLLSKNPFAAPESNRISLG